MTVERKNTTGAKSRPMSLEEARAVLWVRPHARPLGELLDEGFLDREKLEWASRWAYNADLREAAAVLLQWMDQGNVPSPQHPSVSEQVPPLEVPITVEQARATIWPFPRGKGRRMGELMDAGRLTLKDLAYAVENAWDERVRQAAAVLMALSLNRVVKEPPPPAGLLKVISGGRSFAERKEWELTMWEMAAAGFIIGIGIATLFWDLSVHPLGSRVDVIRKTISPPTGIIVVVGAFLILIGALMAQILVMNFAFRRLDRAIENYRKGWEGEKEVEEMMRNILDGHWTLFRNVRLPGNKGDLDAILVGPPGVWVLEVKAFNGDYQNIGEHWMRREGRRWKYLRPSPSTQAKQYALQLHRFLKGRGIQQWVEPVVVWAGREGTLKIENPAVPVWTLDHLPEELGNIWQSQTIDDETRARIEEELAALCPSKPGGSTILKPAA